MRFLFFHLQCGKHVVLYTSYRILFSKRKNDFQHRHIDIELLKRHKASRDAGIITPEEFMEIYHGIMKSGSSSIGQVPFSSLPPSSSSSSSSKPKSTTAKLSNGNHLRSKTISNQQDNSSLSSQKPAVSILSEDSSGPANKVYIIIIKEIVLFLNTSHLLVFT